MNRKQKACLLVGIAVIMVMGLYPPWVIEKHLGAVSQKVKFALEPGPYCWIGSPPEERKDGLYQNRIVYTRARFIDLYRLGVQFFVVAVVTAGLVITFRDEKATKQ